MRGCVPIVKWLLTMLGIVAIAVLVVASIVRAQVVDVTLRLGEISKDLSFKQP
jgi:hypothetical protein